MIAKNGSGVRGEAYAARRLRREGYRIIAKNYRGRYGEIDLIIANRDIIAFVEVKTRRNDGYYRPAEAVTKDKQHKIIRTAYQYLEEFPSALQPRFDVVEIIIAPTARFAVQEYVHLCDAFGTE